MTRSIRREMRLLDKMKENEDKYYDIPGLFGINSSSYYIWTTNGLGAEVTMSAPINYGTVVMLDSNDEWVRPSIEAANNIVRRRGYAPEILSNDTVVATFNEGEDND